MKKAFAKDETVLNVGVVLINLKSSIYFSSLWPPTEAVSFQFQASLPLMYFRTPVLLSIPWPESRLLSPLPRPYQCPANRCAASSLEGANGNQV